jgi:type VI secretion system protein ImpL
MFSNGDQLKSAIGMTAVISIYTVVGAIVWFLGPAYGMGYAEQLILIGLILLTWPFAIVINRQLKKSRERAESNEAEPTPGSVDGGQSPAPLRAVKGKPAAARQQYERLANSLAEVVQWLRGEEPSVDAVRGLQGRFDGLMKRLRVFWYGDALKQQDPVYRLPWLLVAGRPESGKTSLVLASGLDFLALPSQKHSDLHVLRSTTNSEWRVTDSLVLLDTAGRYQTEHAPHLAEWAALIELLKKNRELRPFDSFLLVANAAWVVNQSEEQIDDQARILRRQLDELMKSVGMEFPVYLVFTNMDSVEGFKEFFAPFEREERWQVWGATIPLDQTQRAYTLFDTEFDELNDVLLRRRLARLGRPASAQEQLNVFNFPLRFGAMRRKLSSFTSVLFSPRPLPNRNPFLRGFYFTGSPSHSNAQAAAGSVVTQISSGVRTVRDGYFSRNFFTDVLWNDKDLLASRSAHRIGPNRVRNVVLSIAAVLFLILFIGVVNSYNDNQRLISEAQKLGIKVEEIKRNDRGLDPIKKEPAATRQELTALDNLREELKTLDDYERESPPLNLRFGLYSGGKINPQLRNIYFEAITQRFYKRMVTALEDDLRAFASGTGVPRPAADTSAGTQASAAASEEVLERHYDLLKAYLMLGDRTRADNPTFLVNQLEEYWKKSSTQEMMLVSHRQLEFFAEQANRADAPHIKVDERLVNDVRAILLRQYPPINRYYKNITSQTNNQVASVSVDAIVGVRNGEIITGKSSVPGSFTLEGYREHMREAIKSAPENMSKDNWVMGDMADNSASKNPAADVSRLREKYFREYAEQWRNFLKGVRLRDFNRKEDAVLVLNALSGSESPLDRVLITVEHHTNLSAPPVGGFLRRMLLTIKTSRERDTDGNSEVEQQFRPLFQFVAAPERQGTSSLTQYRAILNSLIGPLSRTDQLAQTQSRLMTSTDELGLTAAENQLTQLLSGLDATVPGKDAAEVLRQPLRNLRAMIYGGGAAEIEKIWREQIYPSAHKLEAGFPFTETDEASITLLTQFLNPVDGQFTKFFDDRLRVSFDDVDGRWKLKEEQGAYKFSDEFQTYLNNARRLREALFPKKGSEPQVPYTVTLDPVADTDVILKIDGNSIETHGKSATSKTLYWPESKGSEAGVTITVINSSGQESAGPSYPGGWGVLRMVLSGKSSKTSDNQFTLSWTVGGVNVRARLRPDSPSAHPFQRSLFTDLHAPSTLQK